MREASSLHNASSCKAELRRAVKLLPHPSGADSALWLESFKQFPGNISFLVGYMPLPDEPDCTEIMRFWLKEKGQVFLPAFDRETEAYSLSAVSGLGREWLAGGKYGIPEPKQEMERMFPPCIFGEKALWLVPGLAFSRDGSRLGRGAGYYDRLLAGTDAVKVGIVYESGLLPYIPAEDHDVRMDYLMTETGIVKI